MQPVAVGRSVARTFQSSKSAQASIKIAARAIERSKAKDTHSPVADAAEQMFAFQQNIAMAAAWRGWCLLIHPVPFGIAVDRATARVDDLPQFPQLWQQ